MTRATRRSLDGRRDHVTETLGNAHAPYGRYTRPTDDRRDPATAVASTTNAVRPLSCFCLLNKGASLTLGGERRVGAQRHSPARETIDDVARPSPARRREVVDATRGKQPFVPTGDFDAKGVSPLCARPPIAVIPAPTRR